MAQDFLSLFTQAAMPAARDAGSGQQPEPWAGMLGPEHGGPTRTGPER